MANAAPHTGIAAVDAAIDAALSRDIDALRQAIVYTPAACVTEPEGPGSPPTCRPGESEGTLVDVLPSAQCEGFFSRPDAIDLDGVFNVSVMGLYGVYRTPADFFPPGAYAVVFTQNRPGIDEAGRELVMTDAGIVGINYGCGETPQQMVEFQHLTDTIIPPR
jgi:hypothetical protein